jgi:membrane-associated phospholipid phosphatase
MRTAEWINLAVFSFLTGLGWYRRLPGPRRMNVTVIGMAALAATFAGARAGEVLPPLAASVVRDWLPAPLLLMVYWQAGQFFLRIDESVQSRFARLDARLVTPVLDWCVARPVGRVLLTWLELAYLFCYPMVPFALAAVYLLRRGQEADHFWSVVLPATYFCYVMVPFVQTLPPRMLGEHARAAPPPTEVRKFNLWILLHASIHANTFPSAHVAASMACALVLLRLDLGVGLGFLVVAISIALGAVAGRYHYAIDAIAGTVVAVIAFVAAGW